MLVGTSGYSYDDWVGPVYPEGTNRNDFLRLYAEQFAFTELNFTYYRQPTADGLQRIARKTPPGFQFSVKANRSLTHDRGSDWENEAVRFARAVATLREAPGEEDPGDALEKAPGGGTAPRGRLAGVLLQFPFSFHYTRDNRQYLASLTSALKPLRLFVEFRNAEWDRESVWREMERRELGLVVPDLPRLSGLPAPPARLTAPWGYVRFHGRNRESWWSGTNITRYDYLYSEEELREWVGPITQMAVTAETVLVAFNNHFAGQAVKNAGQLAGML